MSDLLIPDVSEFQTVDWSRFSGPVIVRAHNGGRADYKWAQNAAGASKQPFWGVYQYLPAAADPAAAARALLQTIGGYRPHVVVLDLEEGTGDQQPRQHAWLAVMASAPFTNWTYSGDYFAHGHNLDNVQWVASYGSREPAGAHILWQFTDRQNVAGIGTCDCSVFHGSVDDLLRLTSNTPTPPPPAPPEDSMVRLMRPDKDTTVFVVTDQPRKFKIGDPYWLADFVNRFGAQILPPVVGGPTVSIDTINGVKVEVVNPLFLAPIPSA